MGNLSSPENIRANRLREADLLVCRLLSDWVQDRDQIEEIRRESLDQEIMARDPSRVADNLSGHPSETIYFDLQRLLTIIREVK
jgi:hypothetical protein